MRLCRLTSWALIVGLLAHAGCVTIAPPETDYVRLDYDRLACFRTTTANAIAACTRVVNRADPSEVIVTEGGAAVVYGRRALSARQLARHLLAEGRDEEALAAAAKSLELLQRYDVRRTKEPSPFHTQAAVDQQMRWLTFNLAQSNYIAGVTLLRLRRWDPAAKHLADAVAQDTGHVGAWAALGVAANQIGQYGESRRAFEKVLSLDAGYFTDDRAIQRLISDASRDERTYRLGDPPADVVR